MESSESTERSSIPSEHPFVGREAELSRLLVVLDEVAKGNGRVAMLVGEPGIGKTRTAEEFCARATAGPETDGPIDALWGRCYEGEGAPIFWPWVQIVRSFLEKHSAEEATACLGTGAAAIAEMVPRVAERLGKFPALEGLSDQASARFRLFDSFSTFLKAAAKTPLIIVLEDLHWADEASLLLLEFLAHQISDSSLLVLGTYRDVELRRTRPLERTLGDLARERHLARIPLKGLDQESVSTYVAEASGADETDELADTIFARTDGNPLFVSEVVLYLVDEGALKRGRAPGAILEMTRIPEGIRETIGRRLSRLSEECNRLLKVAAVIGREFSIAILAHLETEATEESLIELLEEAVRGSIIDELPDRFGWYRFGHALTQQTLAEELTTANQVRLHARIGTALEELYGDQADERATELVEHFAKAEAITGQQRLVRYLLIAGEKALAAYAYEDAIDYYKRGIDARARRGNIEIEEIDARLHFGLARAQSAMLDPEYVVNFHIAFNYYEKSSKVAGMVEVATFPFITVFFAPVIDERFENACERCLALAANDSVEEGYLRARLAFIRYLRTGDYEAASGDFQCSLAIAEKHSDSGLELSILYNWASVDGQAFHFDRAIEKATQALQLARARSDLRAEYFALSAAGHACRQLNDPREIEYFDALLSVAERLRERSVFVYAYLWGFVITWERAELDRCYDYVRKVQRLTNNVYPWFWLAWIAAQRGNLDECWDYIDSAVHMVGKPQDGLYIKGRGLGIISYLTGDSRFLEIDRRFELDMDGMKPPLESNQMLANIGRAWRAIIGDDRAAASDLYRRLVDGELRVKRTGFYEGLLSRTAGETHRAIDHFRDAIEYLRDRGSRLWVCWASLWCAECLVECGGSEDTAAARALAEEGLGLAKESGLVLCEGKLSELIARIEDSDSQTPAPAASYPDGLTEREVEVLGLVAKGLTNKEIGEKLFISTKTVNTHATNIFQKIGAANRAEAAVYASRHGLIEDPD